MEQVAESFARTYGSLLGWVLTWWVGGGGLHLTDLRVHMAPLLPVSRWLTAAVLAVGLVMAAVSLMISRRGRDLAGVLIGLARTALVASAGWLMLASVWSLGDAVATWIVGSRPGFRDFRTHVEQAVSRADPSLSLTLSIVGIACCLGLVTVALARFLIAAALVVMLPVLAAGSVVPGVRGLRTAGAWAFAVAAFQPLSAIVFRIGRGVLLSVDEPVLVLLVSASTFFLAAAALPLSARLAAGAR